MQYRSNKAKLHVEQDPALDAMRQDCAADDSEEEVMIYMDHIGCKAASAAVTGWEKAA